MTRLTTGVAAVLFALAVAGCGNSGDGGSGSSTSGTNTTTSSEEAGGGSSSDAVAWADQVCSAISDDVAALTVQPEIDQSNPQAAKDGLVDYLGKLETTLDSLTSAIEDAGTPPVEGGEEAVTSALADVATAKDAVTTAKDKVAAVPVDDPTKFQTAFTEALSGLEALGSLDSATTFADNAELNAAYKEAKSCKALEEGASTPTS